MSFPKDVPPGPRGKRCRTGMGKLRVNAMTNAVLIRELMDGPSTAAELAELVGLSKQTITRYLMAMHRKKCIRIAGWDRDSSGKQSIRCFGFGDAPDAKKEPKKAAGVLTREGHQHAAFRILERLAA